MAFRLGKKSIEKLNGVHPDLVKVVGTAIQLTSVDFAVICGLRTVAEQRRLVASGASQTMASKHLEGKAVDLMAYIGTRASWELNVYDEIADAMKTAAIRHKVALRWGAAWHIPDIRAWSGTMEQAMNAYVDERRRQGKRPFIDAPHFELP